MGNKNLFITILLTIIISYTIAHTLIINEPPHYFRLEECIQCHVSMPVEGAKNDAPMRFVDNINKLCKRCHTQDIQLSHPVGMKPSMRIPADLPLDENREVTCATCHSIHKSSEDVLGERTYLLRRNTIGRPFCIACHTEAGKKSAETFTITMRKTVQPTHREFITEAHGFKKYAVIDRNSPIDSISTECIGCHDGTVGADTPIPLGAGVWQHGEKGVSSHPIGVDYAISQANDRTLRHQSELNPAIKFFDGKIGCGSCHDPYSKLSMQLVMSNKGSALCLECHKK